MCSSWSATELLVFVSIDCMAVVVTSGGFRSGCLRAVGVVCETVGDNGAIGEL
jgi:hypothetical protein